MKLDEIKEYGSLMHDQLALTKEINDFLTGKEFNSFTVGLIKANQNEIDLIVNVFTDLQFYRGESTPLFNQANKLIKKDLVYFNKTNTNNMLDDYISYTILFIGKKIKQDI